METAAVKADAPVPGRPCPPRALRPGSRLTFRRRRVDPGKIGAERSPEIKLRHTGCHPCAPVGQPAGVERDRRLAAQVRAALDAIGPQALREEGGQNVDDLVVRVLGELVPTGVRRGELRRPGRTLRWVEAGTGDPVVILDAGLGEPGTLAWAGVLPTLSARTRTIAYDRAGVGASDPASPLTADTEIDDLVALAATAGDGQPCVLAGHSWGGLLAQMAALRRPDLVAGLALVDPVHEEAWAEAPWWFHAVLFSYGAVPLLLQPFGLQGQAVRSVYSAFAARLTEDQALRSLILDAYASCYRERSQVLVIREENRLGFTSVASFREMRLSARLPDVPMTVLSASRGLPPGPPRLRKPLTRIQAGLAEAVGGEHMVVDAGHSIHQEQPEVVAAAIGRVVDRVRLSRPQPRAEAS